MTNLRAPMETPSFSPSDFVATVNQTFEFAYPFVSIVGEVANFRVSKGKWVYFDLKDETASVKMFGTVYVLPGPLEDGMMVKVGGAPRLSPQYGFSVSFQQVMPVGKGTLKRAADLLRRKLETEGLFDPERKRGLPYPPAVVGLVTSGQSAAYRDFLTILESRWAGVVVKHVDVGVQGEAAVSEVVRGIELLNQTPNVDVIVLTRGGGSADDLAVFSTEPVVRAVAGSRVPTMVAIGHEVDISLAELAADMRASTPSNAAERLVPDAADVRQELRAIGRSADAVLKQLAARHTAEVAAISSLVRGRVREIIREHEHDLAVHRTLLGALDPRTILDRGYALVRGSDGDVVRSVAQVGKGDVIEVSFADGSARAEVQ
jgi:exodeoxyribonuclease VII large subunit